MSTILILEDDEGIAQLERRRLERAGYAVKVAAKVAEAKRILAEGGVDLMVLDYKLNDAFDGLEFHHRLRQDGMNVPSILVTGYSDEAMLTQAIRAGIRDFLPKTPDYLDFLVPTVERVLNQVRTERQLEEERAARSEAEAQRKALADEDRRKDEFLAMLAHELRNPLSAIASAVQLARVAPDPDHAAWAGDVIDRQVRHLSRLIDDLLDVSRIRLGKIQLRMQALDAAEVLPRAVEAVRPLIESKGHVLTVSLAPGPLRIEADPTRLEQIVVNLLANAAKYTDEGGRICLSARPEAGEVVIVVADNGVGIAPEMLPKIFGLFVQVEGSRDRSQGGLGIGLTLVWNLVTRHGGAVSAASDGPGLGSAFTVRLPESSRPVEDAPTRAMPNGPSRTLRVLVVDDNEDSARGLARFLRFHGHTVEVAHDGPSALDSARAHPPDAVLLDIGLPGMDGYEVAAALRREGSSATIVAISGYGQDEDRRRSLASGCDHHLVKPVDHDQLLAMLSA